MHAGGAWRAADRSRREARRALAVGVLAVLALHAAVFGLWPGRATERALARLPARAMDVTLLDAVAREPRADAPERTIATAPARTPTAPPERTPDPASEPAPVNAVAAPSLTPAPAGLSEAHAPRRRAVAAREPPTSTTAPPSSRRRVVATPSALPTAPADRLRPASGLVPEPARARLPSADATTMSGAVDALASPDTGDAPAGGVAVGGPAAPSDAAAAPVYPTRLPPAGRWHYALRRGTATGQADLDWQPGADGYELRLEAGGAAIPTQIQTSRGGFDAAGLAPQRFTDRRARRGAAAANFERDSGRIRFSGPSTELALAPGVQDRLSWMVQLAAIVAADPARRVPGAETALQVVGARGDAALWTFLCVGVDGVDAPAGTLPATRFVREPRGPYDVRVEVWLDPARGAWPVAVSIGSVEGGAPLELRLDPAPAGP